MRILRLDNWRQAAGEVLLIVVGILIALFVDSQWEQRKARQEETEILSQILESLKLDRTYLLEQLAIAERRLQLLNELRGHVAVGSPHTPELNDNFRAMRGWLVTEATAAPYDDLKSRGLDLISNQNLRQQLIMHYDRIIPRVEARDRIDQAQSLSEQHPYARTRFRFDGAPLNYGEIIRDPEFLYLLEHKIASTENRTIPIYQEAIRSNENLVSAIEREIGPPNH